MKNDLIYFDNAATTFPKPDSVKRAVIECLDNYCANSGRSGHSLSNLASEAVYSVRESVASFLDFEFPERVVFTPGATFGLNLAMKSLISQGSHVLISDIEHNSVLRVAAELERTRGVEYDIFNSSDVPNDVPRLIKKNTTHVVSTLASNVDGSLVDVKELSRISREYGVGLIFDASQLLGHEEFSLNGLNFDALCCAGHKGLFGIQGVGFVVFGNNDGGDGIISGGSGSDSKNLEMPSTLPEKFEAGTLPLPSIVSLGAGIDHINSVGVDNISKRLSAYTSLLEHGLKSIGKVEKIFGRMGILSFTSRDVPCEEVARRLDEYGVCTRAGFHCNPLAHRKLGTYDTGTVRISLSHTNTTDEIERFLNILEHVI
ncbi:MAG: aminotransferase class V-fold PLP-dependent enzyme [Clostridia bacterium]|nr:aminotransferase class V-fold PLP-dependent enzyme [Clostridia bacterium]